MRDVLKCAALIVGAGLLFLLSAAIKELDRIAEDTYPWGKDGSTWEGDDEE